LSERDLIPELCDAGVKLILQPILKLLKRVRRPRWAQVLLRIWARLFADMQAYRELVAVSLALTDHDEAIRACQAMLALDPNQLDARWNLAVMNLQRGAAVEAAPHFAKHDSLKTGTPRQMRACRVSWMDPERAARGEPYVGSLTDALVDTGYWSVIEGDRIYVRETHDRALGNAPFVRGRVSPDGQQMIVALPNEIPEIKETCILLGGDDNYSHWLSRNLIKLALIEDRPDLRDLPLLINSDLRRYQREYLELLGIPKSRLIKVPRGTFVRCREVFVPTVLRNHPRMRVGINWIRAKFAHLLTAPADASEQIYLSRRDSDLRRLLNDAELAEALTAEGFLTVVASELSVSDQIQLFSRIRTIVAPHGAGMTNLIFAPRGALVVEIASANIAHMEDFRTISKEMGQRIVTLVSHDFGPESFERNSMHRDYRVDVQKVLAMLRENLGSEPPI
jgi:capsular polysaccharide biosynthesis protein